MIPGSLDLNTLTHTIIKSAIEVHRALGPGLLESAYEACLKCELAERGLKVESQRPLPIIYKSIRLQCAYRIDLVVEDQIIVEVKAIDALAPIHEQQLLSYLRLADIRVGLLINFNVPVLTQGVRRVANNAP
jgi:GxxExxY protein